MPKFTAVFEKKNDNYELSKLTSDKKKSKKETKKVFLALRFKRLTPYFIKSSEAFMLSAKIKKTEKKITLVFKLGSADHIEGFLEKIIDQKHLLDEAKVKALIEIFLTQVLELTESEAKDHIVGNRQGQVIISKLGFITDKLKDPAYEALSIEVNNRIEGL